MIGRFQISDVQISNLSGFKESTTGKYFGIIEIIVSLRPILFSNYV